MIGEISGLACALCWALSSIATKSLAGKFEPLVLNLLRCLGASFMLWALIPFFPGLQDLSKVPPLSAVLLTLSAVLGISVGDTIYIRGLKLIRVTLAFPIAQTSMPVLTLAAAVLFLDEKITWTMALGTALVLTGISLNAVSLGGSRAGIPALEKKGLGVALVLLAACFWAVSVSFLKIALTGVNLILANGIRFPMAALALLSVLLFQKPGGPRTKMELGNLALAAGTGILAFGIGGILFLLSIHYAGVGKAAVLTSCAPILALPLSVWMLKERVTAQTIGGTILAAIGIALIF